MDEFRTNTSMKTNCRDHNFGQAMVEFALILPIALLMIFTIIEIARMASAWLVVVNSARVGLRYAVTGTYDADFCTSAIDFNGNGSICDQEPNKENRNEEIDAARLLSIYDLTETSAVGIMKDLSVTTYGESGFFDVTVCSTNSEEDDDGNEILRVYHPPPDEYCSPSDHPGDPSTGSARVLVAVTFEHPVLLPILNRIAPSVTLHGERTGIVEQFRVARVLGLPPVISVPSETPKPATITQTPTITPTPTNTSTSTNTPTPTITSTSTNTPSPTSTPNCDLYSITDFSVNSQFNRIETFLTNGDTLSTEVDRIVLYWDNAELLSDIIIGENNLNVDWFKWDFNYIWSNNWDGVRDFTSATDTSVDTPSAWFGPRPFNPGDMVNFEVDFNFALGGEYNGALTSWGLLPQDFGAAFFFSNGCTLELPTEVRIIPTPTPDPFATSTPSRTVPPTNTPIPTATSIPTSTITLTPSNTSTPSKTPSTTPTSDLPTDQPTNTPTDTSTPTNTPWPTMPDGG